MRESEKKVGRADNNLEGAREIANGEQRDNDTGDGIDSADRHAHGTHGRGRGDEKLDVSPPTEPDATSGSDRGGSGSWGSEGSGGSVMDKRPDR